MWIKSINGGIVFCEVTLTLQGITIIKQSGGGMVDAQRELELNPIGTRYHKNLALTGSNPVLTTKT